MTSVQHESAAEVTATVAILSYNGEKYLRRILEALRTQTGVESFEVLVIDSGSTDATLSIVQEFAEVRLHRIPNAEFGHGRTRNLAARLARGRFIVYLTHDAVPLHSRWLAEMLEPFAIHENVVAVLGKQVPRPACFPLVKYEIMDTFAGFGPDFGTTLFRKTEPPLPVEMQHAVTFYSDVNSAARREFLCEVIPYQDVSYAEDQAFGHDLIEAGYWKAYASRGAVEHSNDMTYREYGMRIFDETVGLRRLGRSVPQLRIRGVLWLSLRGALRDSRRIIRDPSFSRIRKLYWLLLNPCYHLRKWLSLRNAARVSLDDAAAIAAASLESARKQ